jgi:putative hydrolase of the HAD superfamily
MVAYKHIFFDLDRTLYDFDKNNLQTLKLLFESHKLYRNGIATFDDFFKAYKEINTGLWEQYKRKEITKEFLNHKRFFETLSVFGLDNGMARQMASDYIRLSPLQTALVEGAKETLDYLMPRYKLHIITNGFEEIQFKKIRRCGLDPFFTHVITSEAAGAQKPHPDIFIYASEQTGAIATESLIIGDDPESDIAGGRQAGMDQVWLARPGEVCQPEPTYTIADLRSLISLL